MTTSIDTDWGRAFDDLWQRLGPETRRALVDLLPEDWSFADKRILDFGCGWGRTLRHFTLEAQEAEFWGVDVDGRAIERLERELSPPVRAAQCPVDPPLEFESGTFDLVWAISVFTHLTDNSLAWMAELHRVLKPDALLIATYLGRWHSELLTGEPWDEDRIGMNVLRHDESFERGGPLVMMSDWWVRAHWGRGFEILDIAPRIHNQSWALMRKREVDVTVEGLARPEDDPRELLAARYNVEQLRREVAHAHSAFAALEERHATALEDLRREYEGSRSWALTRPLRQARKLPRSVGERIARQRERG